MSQLPAARRDQMLDTGARWAVSKGLQVPAIFFLEMHKPLTTLAAVGYAFFQPPLMLLFGFRRTEELRLLLAERENIEELIRRIELVSESKKASRTGEGR